MSQDYTAIELLKAYGVSPLPNMPTLGQLMAAWVRDKEFDPEAVAKVAGASALGRLMWQHLVGATEQSPVEEARASINNVGRNIHAHMQKEHTGLLDTYTGTRSDNVRVDRALSEIPRKSNRYGQGAVNRFTPLASDLLPSSVRSVNIAVIGHGAAGILVDRTLRSMGFGNVVVFEKSKTLGIWSHENVYGRSRNNPVRLTWNETDLEAAPGVGNSVKEFLTRVSSGATVKPGTVSAVFPGSHFNHKVAFVETTIENKEYPIVINCSGVGTPRPLNDKSRMITNVTTTNGGERWQRKLEAKDCRGKKFMFIGLGNSTAEMLRQIHDLQDAGMPVDYRIMTHYPGDAIQNPDDVIEKVNRKYRVFRDLTLPDLTSWQGDLSESRYDYYRALRTNRIIAGVNSWTKNGNTIICKTNRGGYARSTFNDIDHLFTLIGYAPTVSSLSSYNIRADHKDNCAELDYDGEVQTGEYSTGRLGHRLHKGYFAFGAMTANPQNKNAFVIPGMLFRLNDLMVSVILRAAEASLLAS